MQEGSPDAFSIGVTSGILYFVKLNPNNRCVLTFLIPTHENKSLELLFCDVMIASMILALILNTLNRTIVYDWS